MFLAHAAGSFGTTSGYFLEVFSDGVVGTSDLSYL